jgi:DNA-directed RNA polymerase specialized sigma24 family protein
MTKLSGELEEELIQRYLNGENASQLAAAYGFAASSSVLSLLERHGVTSRSDLRPSRIADPEFKASVQQMIEQGSSDAEISEVLEVPLSTVSSWRRREFGITRRTRRPMVREALPDDADVLRMRDEEGMTFGEIGQALDPPLTYEGARARYHRIKKN